MQSDRTARWRTRRRAGWSPRCPARRARRRPSSSQSPPPTVAAGSRARCTSHTGSPAPRPGGRQHVGAGRGGEPALWPAMVIRLRHRSVAADLNRVGLLKSVPRSGAVLFWEKEPKDSAPSYQRALALTRSEAMPGLCPGPARGSTPRPARRLAPSSSGKTRARGGRRHSGRSKYLYWPLAGKVMTNARRYQIVALEERSCRPKGILRNKVFCFFFSKRSAFFLPYGCSSSFCTRQFSSSATYSSFSDGHAIWWIHPNCLSCLPAWPSTPSTVPSSASL